ncbi:MAG: sigma-54-dependent Fis family transcriptional regulator [Bacteroidales bacterium]|nr:sigma-54-dependent Fis family transcriptional regulator [Bacteroidales bacterium]
MQLEKGKILIIDDNKQILDSLQILLKSEFGLIDTIKNPNLIPEKIRSTSYDIILLDMNFSAGVNTGNEGIFWLTEILKTDPLAIVILITAYGDIELAVKAIKEGATDFITKPWDTEKLLATLSAAFKLRKSKLELFNLKNRQHQLNKDIDRQFNVFTGKSPVMKEIYTIIDKVAATDANVLILGENGTGKEIFAREIHRKSKRSQEVFMGVDVASLSETLFESEMFGHEKGAFTDAGEKRMGRFETATDGTLFLDEIGNLSLPVQAKLLTALQNREIYRLGSNVPIPINIRLISATNKNLFQMIEDKFFREDLLYRLNTIQIKIPPLRERKEDIPGLADWFLTHYTCKYEKTGISITNSGYDKLINYSWPGNIRELKHAIEKVVILSESKKLQADDFYLKEPYGDFTNAFDSNRLIDLEQIAIIKALEKCKGNIAKTAKMLDISRTTLYSKIKKYGL